MKKTFLISGILLALALLLLGIYNFVFRNNVNNPTVEKKEATIEVKNTDNETASSQNSDLIQQISDTKSISPYYDETANSILYFAPGSRDIKKVSLDINDTLSIMSLSGDPLRAIWSPQKKQALVEMRTMVEVRWFLVDVDAKTEKVLKGGMETPVWTNLGDKIVYKYYDTQTKERSLNIANPDGTDWKKIGDSPFKNMNAVVTPQGSLLSFWNQGNAFEETSLRTVSLVGGDVKTIFSGKYGADYLYSQDGQKILVSSVEKKGGSGIGLGVLLNQGAQYQNLQIPTLVTKATWSKNNKTVYYSLPGSLPDGAILPNDYFSKPIHTQDTFWKVDLETGVKSRIIETKDIMSSVDAISMMVVDNDTLLIFLNRNDGKLYTLKIQ